MLRHITFEAQGVFIIDANSYKIFVSVFFVCFLIRMSQYLSHIRFCGSSLDTLDIAH